MGSSTPKQFLPVLGTPLLMHTMAAFHRFDAALEQVLVLPEQHLMLWKQLTQKHHFSIPHKIALGGPQRFDSVRNGLNLISSKSVVGVHDGVRPFVTNETLAACYETAEAQGNAIPVVPMHESIRQIVEGGSQSVPRDYYRKVQTPQCFHTDVLKAAYQQPYQKHYTDDASVVEAMGEAIHLVNGNRENIKITTPVDLLFAEALLKQSQ